MESHKRIDCFVAANAVNQRHFPYIWNPAWCNHNIIGISYDTKGTNCYLQLVLFIYFNNIFLIKFNTNTKIIDATNITILYKFTYSLIIFTFFPAFICNFHHHIRIALLLHSKYFGLLNIRTLLILP